VVLQAINWQEKNLDNKKTGRGGRRTRNGALTIGGETRADRKDEEKGKCLEEREKKGKQENENKVGCSTGFRNETMVFLKRRDLQQNREIEEKGKTERVRGVVTA